MSRSGFEPLTQGFSVLCSNQLSYLDKESHQKKKTILMTFYFLSLRNVANQFSEKWIN